MERDSPMCLTAISGLRRVGSGFRGGIRITCGAVLLLLGACVHHVGGDGSYRARSADVREVTVERGLVYREVDGRRLEADVFRAAGDDPAPGVLVVHGGGWTRGERGDMEHIARRLAERGFVAVNVSYRLAPAHVFPAASRDLEDAVRWMRTRASALGIDPRRIGAFGYSAGGHLVALLGAAAPIDGGKEPGDASRVQAVVAGGAPFDLAPFAGGKLVPQFLGVSFADHPEVYRQASPLEHVSPDDPPMFLYHGSWDALVDVSQAERMKLALDVAGVPAELYVVRGLGHAPLFLWGRSSVEAAIDFLERSLAVRASRAASQPAAARRSAATDPTGGRP